MRKIDPDNFRRATRDTPREVNRRILLNLVREKQPISRADLAREMGVARGTITALVNELLADGLVREGETADVPRGRKPTLLHIRAHDRLALGVDVHRTNTHLLLSDFDERVLARQSFPTPDTPEALVDTLLPRIRHLPEAHREVGACQGVGVVVPGVVEGRTGRVINAPTLGWTNTDLRGPLQRELDFPVYVERDAVACALARMWLAGGTRSDPASFVYLVVAEGVGTGLVVNGQVVRGSESAAGEFGHEALSFDGPRCSCGSTGCWEAYVSDAASVDRYVQAVAAANGSATAADGLTVREIVRRSRVGDACARDALLATGRYLGIGIGAVFNALNPGALIVGGEIARAWDLVEPVIRAEVDRLTLTRSAGSTPIEPEPAHAEQRLRGATALVMAPLFAAPQIA
ncbi:MAG: ROK family protein [Gemmatimonadota bacterium]